MNIPDKFWVAAKWASIFLTVFLIVVSIKEVKSLDYVGVNTNTINTINVDGTGDAVAVPDIASFSFTVTETAKTVADAQAQATTKVNAAMKAVRDGGVADKDIQTLSYSIYPHYDYQKQICPDYSSSCPPSKSILTGYDVSQSTMIKVRDLKNAGTLFTTIGALNVHNIDDLSFSVDKPESVKAEARAKAIANAQVKANELAKALGVSIVRIVSYNESSGNYPRPMYAMGGTDMMSAKVAAVAPEVSVGEQKVTSNISITYEIK